MIRRKWLSLAATALVACGAIVYAEGTGETPTPPPIKGNPKTKVYHKPECRYYKAKSSTAEFKTEADAKKAGYKPCKKCGVPKKDKKDKEKPAAATPGATE